MNDEYFEAYRAALNEVNVLRIRHEALLVSYYEMCGEKIMCDDPIGIAAERLKTRCKSAHDDYTKAIKNLVRVGRCSDANNQ